MQPSKSKTQKLLKPQELVYDPNSPKTTQCQERFGWRWLGSLVSFMCQMEVSQDGSRMPSVRTFQQGSLLVPFTLLKLGVWDRLCCFPQASLMRSLLSHQSILHFQKLMGMEFSCRKCSLFYIQDIGAVTKPPRASTTLDFGGCA